jgi:hypothetical protein
MIDTPFGQLDITSLIVGAAGMLVLVAIFFLVKGISKKKPVGLPLLREKIMLGHESLKQANQILSDIYSAFNDAEEVMGR